MSSNQKQQVGSGGPQTQRFSSASYVPVTAGIRTDGYQMNAATSQGGYVPQQPNQSSNPAAVLRTIPSGQPPNGPPNQSSTPPSDMKPHQVTQSQMPVMIPAQQMHRSNFYSRGLNSHNQVGRVPNHQPRTQQNIYAQPAPYSTVQFNTVPIQAAAYYPRPQAPGTYPVSVAPQYMVTPTYFAAQTNQGAQQLIQYYPTNQMTLQRAVGHHGQPGATLIAPGQPIMPNMMPAATAASPLQQPPQSTYQRQKRPRPNAVSIIHPVTGADLLKDMFESSADNTASSSGSHAPSAESSTCPTPQPNTSNSAAMQSSRDAREIQAAFSKQVALAINADDTSSTHVTEYSTGGTNGNTADAFPADPQKGASVLPAPQAPIHPHHHSTMTVQQSAPQPTPPPPPATEHHMMDGSVAYHIQRGAHHHPLPHPSMVQLHLPPPPPPTHQQFYPAQAAVYAPTVVPQPMVVSASVKPPPQQQPHSLTLAKDTITQTAINTNNNNSIQTMDKESTPVVSANCDSVEVTITKKENSPVKIRKQQLKEHKEQQLKDSHPTIASHVSSSFVPPAKSFISTGHRREVAEFQGLVEYIGDKPAVEAKDEKHSASSSVGDVVVHVKDETKPKKDVKTPTDSTAHTLLPTNVHETVNSISGPKSGSVVTFTQQVSAKTKHNQKSGSNKQQDGQQKNQSVPSSQQTVTEQKPPQLQPPYPIPQPQPPKPNNKTNRKYELNQKGSTKEGSDMDAINDNNNKSSKMEKPPMSSASSKNISAKNYISLASSADTTTTTSATGSSSIAPDTSSRTVDSSSMNKVAVNVEKTPPPVLKESPDEKRIPSSSTIEEIDSTVTNGVLPPSASLVTLASTVVVTKTMDTTSSSSVTTTTTTTVMDSVVKPVDSTLVSVSAPIFKTLPKNKIDVTDIVKDKPREFKLPPPMVENLEDNSTTGSSSDKLLIKVKNQINSTTTNGDEIDHIVPPYSSLPYREDQWTPQNQDGKKKYDRDFLMALRDYEKCKKVPDGDAIGFLLDNHVGDRYSMSGRNDFNAIAYGPNYGGKSGSQQRLQTPKSNKQPIQPKGVKPQQIIKVSISLNEDVKLNVVENAWRPERLIKDENQSEDMKTQQLLKRVRGVLNKLTPEKFDKLLKQIRDLPIDTEERLDGVIDLVFEKALDEPKYSSMYASLCNQLSSIKVTSSNVEGVQTDATFYRLLVSRCEKQFHHNPKEEKEHADRLREIDECTDPELKKELEEIFEEYDRKLRLRSVGNIRFIGELFNRGMLSNKIVMQCLNKLLAKRDEDNLECMCKLLTTVGHLIDKDDALIPILQQMRAIIDRKSGNVSSRIRFMMLDVFDLRQNKWVQRRQDAPQTMEQFQRDVEHEEKMSMLALNATMPLRREEFRPGGSNQGQGGASTSGKRQRNVPDDNGWVTKKPPIHKEKLRINVPEEETLGSAKQFGNWGKGSTYKSDAMTATTTVTNMYSALDGMDTDKRFGSRSGVSKDISSGGYTSKGHSLERATNSSSGYHGGSSSTLHPSYDGRRSGSRYESQRRTTVETTTPRTSLPGPTSFSSSFPTILHSGGVPTAAAAPSVGLKPGVVTSHMQQPATKSATPSPPLSQSAGSSVIPPTQQKEAPKLTQEQIAVRLRNSLEEYFSGATMAEDFFKDLTMFEANLPISQLITDSYMYALDKKTTHRIKTGQLFSKLLAQNAVSVNTYSDGLSEIFVLGEDLLCDIPKLWEFLAECLLHPICEKAFPLKALHRCCEPLISDNKCQPLLLAVCKSVINQLNIDFLRRLWEQSGLTFRDFMSNDDSIEFNKKIEIFPPEKCSTSSRQTESAGTKCIKLGYEEIHVSLLQLLNSDAAFDQIVAWITKHVPNPDENKFVRVLTAAIFEHCMKGRKGEAVTQTLRRHYNLFAKYIDSSEQYELQCLYALQSVSHNLQHPQGMLLSICEKLLDDTVLSQESFIAWEKSEDVAEHEGKGVALMQLTSFFTNIKEADECSSDGSTIS